MVGNDVVDLRDPEANPHTLSHRFDERVFCPEERATLSRSPERRWKLWAAKEAAYKVVVKQELGAIFSPSRFRVSLEEDARAGIVTWGSGIVPVRVHVEDDAVHAVATSAGCRVVFGSERLAGLARGERAPEASSESVRSLATERLAVALGLDPGAIEIRKAGRVPELFVDGSPAPADLSLSHHGDVVGFACEIFEARRGSRAESSPLLESVQ